VKTVLVVDDDDNIRDTIVDILHLEGYHAEAFTCAAGVVERVAAGDVVLVVTDLNMPDVDGMTLLQSVLVKTPTVPVVMLTGAGFEERASEALAHGAFACFAKPFNIDEFLACVARAIGAPDEREHA